MLIKKENENGESITCTVKFIDSVRSMLSSLSSQANTLTEGSHKDKCKNFKSDLEYMTVNNVSLEFKCRLQQKIWGRV